MTAECPPYCGTKTKGKILLCPECQRLEKDDETMLKELERNDTTVWGDEMNGRYILKADGSIEANEAVRMKHADVDIDDWLDCDEPWD